MSLLLFLVFSNLNIQTVQQSNKDVLDSARYYYRIENYDLTIKKSLEALSELEAQNRYKDCITASYFLMSAYTNTSKLDSSLYYNSLSLNYARKLGDPKIIASIIANTAIVYMNSGQYTTAIELLNKSLKISKLYADNLGYHRTLLSLADAYKEISLLDSAIKLGYKASNYMETHDQEYWQLVAAENLAQNLLLANDTANAKLKFNEAYELAISLTELSYQAILEIKIAEVLFTQNQDSAIALLNKAIVSSQKLGNPGIIAQAKLALASCYLNIYETQLSEKLIRETQLHFNKSDDKKGVIDYLMLYSKKLIRQDSINKAQKFTDSIISVTKGNSWLFEMNEGLSLNLDLAIRKENVGLVKSLIDRKDSLENVISLKSRDQIIQLYRTKFETAEKDKEIALQKTEILNRNSYIIMLATFLAVASLLGFIFYYRYRLKSKYSSFINTLYIDQRHRVANQLNLISSVLSLHEHSIHTIEGKSILNDAKSRVEAISLIHAQLSDETSDNTLDTKEYFETLTSNLLIQYNKKIELTTTKIDSIKLELDKIIPLGLILSESLTNSLKYSLDARLNISFQRHLTGVKLIVSDNGSGFDLAQTKLKDSYGLQLIETFTKQLNAQLILSGVDGTYVEVHLTKG